MLSREVAELEVLVANDQDEVVRRRLFALADNPELHAATGALPHQMRNLIDLTGSDEWSRSTT